MTNNHLYRATLANNGARVCHDRSPETTLSGHAPATISSDRLSTMKTRTRPPISNTLRELRRSADLMQHELADMAGMPPSLISHFESGRRTPSPHHIEKLSTALKVSPEVFDQKADAERALLWQYRRLPRTSQELVERIVALFLDIADEHEEAAMRRRREWLDRRARRANRREDAEGPTKLLAAKNPAGAEDSVD